MGMLFIVGIKAMFVFEYEYSCETKNYTNLVVDGNVIYCWLLLVQSKVSIMGPVGYGPTTLPLRHSNLLINIILIPNRYF